MRQYWLDQIQVATPCDARWDEMMGNEQVRHCGSCNKAVYNLSGMARADAEMLVAETEGPMCVRFYRRDDGTVLTTDCPVGIAERSKQLGAVLVRAAIFAFLLIGTGIAAIAGGRQPPLPAFDFSLSRPIRSLLAPPTMGAVMMADPGELTVHPASATTGARSLKVYAKQQ